jgi:hypothetical protein
VSIYAIIAASWLVCMVVNIIFAANTTVGDPWHYWRVAVSQTALAVIIVIVWSQFGEFPRPDCERDKREHRWHDWEILARKDRWGGRIRVSSCRDCGFHQTEHIDVIRPRAGGTIIRKEEESE